jgi:hypothetical protein
MSQDDIKIVGLGLDSKDGHKRITQGDRFTLVGGSEETHSKMTETVCKTFEDLDSRGKNLKTIEQKELVDLIEKNTPS